MRVDFGDDVIEEQRFPTIANQDTLVHAGRVCSTKSATWSLWVTRIVAGVALIGRGRSAPLLGSEASFEQTEPRFFEIIKACRAQTHTSVTSV